MSKLTLSDVNNIGGNPTSASSTINANSALIETALENTLSRNGTSPNEMNATLDMNSNRIINLPTPLAVTEPLRLQDLSDFLGSGFPTTASGLAFVPFATIAATNVQSAIEEVYAEASAAVADGDKGDIVVSSSGTVWTVDPVTGTGNFAKSTSPQFTTDIRPSANDGASLGISGTAFSDLFLASGAVINFNAGDVTLTHSSNVLTFGGASSGYQFDAVTRPTTNDAAALGTTTVGWSDLHLATGGVINWANSSARLIHSATAATRRLEIAMTTSEDALGIGYTGDHTYSTAVTGYGVLNQFGATFNTGSGGAVWLQNYSQNLVSVQNSVTVGAVWTFMVQNGTKGVAPTGTITDQVCFYVNQPTGQHSGSASMTISGNYGLRIDNQGTYSGGSGTVAVTNAYALKISDQSGATNNYAIQTGTGQIQFFSGTSVPAGGTAGVGVCMSSTTNLGVFFGSGAPSLSAAKGSLYLRTDGTTTNDRMYVNTNGTTTWTAVTTVA